MMRALKTWSPWLMSVLLVASIGLAGPTIVGSGCSNCVLRTGDTMSGTLASTVASGSNAFSLLNGARLGWTPSGFFINCSASQCSTNGDWTPSANGVASLGLGGANWNNIVWLGTATANIASGSNAIAMATNGARIDLGSGLLDYLTSNGTDMFVGGGAGYLASAIPVVLGSVYVNTTINAFTYGGGTLPAHAATVTDIAFNIRTVGSGGTTNNTFQVSDGTNTCNCTFACNATIGSKIAACANGAGTGCVYAASAALTYGFNSVGDCTVSTDILGNIDVRGKWQ